MESNPCRAMVLYRPNDAAKFFKTPTFRISSPRDYFSISPTPPDRLSLQPYQIPRLHHLAHRLLCKYDYSCHWSSKYHCSNCRCLRMDAEAVETAWAICV
ncbi:hypothetical protein B0H14DRAFT_3498049 [Mycena olivaceomarginata]|nr:hypothetical protein B0H14DRAFT_3498049 [Mycena olivaceomarginata]